MNKTGFHHVAMRSSNFDRSVDFYTGLLGMKPKMAWGEAPQRAIMLDVGGGDYLEIFERPDEPAASATRGMDVAPDVLLHFAIRVDDCTATLEKLREAGVHIAMESTAIDIANTQAGLPDKVPVRIAFFNGPDGELIELFENELT